jgi:SAM-dependent methyltransferase
MLVEEALRRHDVVERMLAEHARRTSDLERHFRLLRRMLGLRKVFMEVGAGDCALAHRVAGYVERAYAVDTSAQVLHALRRPGNVVALRAGAAGFPVPEGSVDVAFSRELVAQHLRSIHRSLAPGGRYLCITRSAAFCLRELRALFLEAGFRKLRLHARFGGAYAKLPFRLLQAFEACLGALSVRVEAVK